MSVGKITLREPVIDYTEVAKPLDIDAISRDVSEIEATTGMEPGYIRLWEHQMDWLLKQERGRQAYLFEVEGAYPQSIFGIRVEYADPPRPIAVLEVDHPLSDEDAEEIRERFEKIYTDSVASLRAEQARILQKAREDRAAAK